MGCLRPDCITHNPSVSTRCNECMLIRLRKKRRDEAALGVYPNAVARYDRWIAELEEKTKVTRNA